MLCEFDPPTFFCQRTNPSFGGVAVLARLEPAIRDFFDLDYAIRNKKVVMENEEFLALVRRKIAVPGTGPINLSKEKREELVRQVGAELCPVLRGRDFEKFDLERVWAILNALGGGIELT